MKKLFITTICFVFLFSISKAQSFVKHVSFSKFDTYAKSLNDKGFTYLFAESKGDISKSNLSYSAMLQYGKGSIDIKIMDIKEFANGSSKLADTNTGVYEKYNHRIVFWSLYKAKQAFLWIELADIDALFILGLQPSTSQEEIEKIMVQIACLDYFKPLK